MNARQTGLEEASRGSEVALKSVQQQLSLEQSKERERYERVKEFQRQRDSVQLFRTFDTDGDAAMSWAEFVAAARPSLLSRTRRSTARAAIPSGARRGPSPAQATPCPSGLRMAWR